MKDIELKVLSGEESCPADALMTDFRKRAKDAKNYPHNIEFSSRSIEFFRQMADTVEESEKNIKFQWDAIPEEELPPLIVKIRINKGRYYLQYLKEIGEDVTLIQCKARKGKNKNGKMKIIKENNGSEER